MIIGRIISEDDLTSYASSESEFLIALRGKNYRDILNIFDELMQGLQVVQPRMYDAVLSRIAEIKDGE